MSIDYQAASRLLQKVGKVSDGALDLACKLYEDGMAIFSEAVSDMPSDCLVYHLQANGKRRGERVLSKRDCALLTDAMPRANGVVLSQGHDDLRCTHRSCGFDVCPVALAACFDACHKLDANADIPLYTEFTKKRHKASERAQAFLDKWGERLVDSDLALKLLLSDVENDFAGAIVLSDESFLDEFLADLERVLVDMGKIAPGADGKAMARTHLHSMIAGVDAQSYKFQSGDEDLPTKRLLVLDRLHEFVNMTLSEYIVNPYNVLQRDFIIERLGHIVDDRYVLVVGTPEEVTSFCALDPSFLHTFDRNRLTLKGMDAAEVLKLYLSYLDDEVRAQIDDADAFDFAFRRYVSFNRDSLPFQGREIADYLAKYANAIGRPELPRSRYESSSLDEMLDQIVGLQQVKDTVRQLEQFAIYRRQAQADGRELPSTSMHMLFTGNPGTGKTMVAGIIATMLYKIGIIRQNKFHEVTAKDLIAAYVGQTDKATHKHVEQALDGVLFIDEAYALTANASGTHFGAEAVAELVKSMDAFRDRLVVIFAGYEKEMADFVEVNPGLASRIGYTFRFQDYSVDELLQIFDGAIASAGFTCDPEARDGILRELVAYYRRFQNFGNGRFVKEVLHRMIVKHANAVAAGTVGEDERYVLDARDVPTRQEMNDITDWAPQAADELLAPLVGIDTLKDKVRDLERVVSFYEQGRRAGLNLPDINMHMLFTGNPGTGKTTVARIVGKILFNVGAVATNKFIEVEADDLTRWNPHNSTTAVGDYIRDAMGGVLFIDEAYALMYRSSGQEIIAQLVKAMEDHKGDFVVIFAGYSDEMRQFVAVNPGLASRIGFRFEFEDYDTDALQQIFELKMDKAGFEVSDDAKERTRAVFKYFHNVKDFGNGRFVDKVIQEVIARHAGNVADGGFTRIEEADIPSNDDLCKIVSMPVSVPSDVSADEAQRRIAIHEMGHAACALALTGNSDIALVTIEQEGFGALGYVEYKRDGGSPLPTAAYLRNRLCSLMGGIAAEELMLGSFSAGGSDDLRQATNLASRYVGRYGMSDIGFLQYVGEYSALDKNGNVDATKLPDEVREAMNGLLEEAFAQAKETIRQNQQAYDQLVDLLCERGTISGDEITETWHKLTGDKHE